MTREQLKKAWPILEAFKDGKKIEFNYDNCNWRPIIDEIDETCIFKYQDEYRIKPTPKLRPWTPEEALGQKVRLKGGNIKGSWLITSETREGDLRACGTPIGFDRVNHPFWYLTNCETIDGKPCGVEE